MTTLAIALKGMVVDRGIPGSCQVAGVARQIVVFLRGGMAFLAIGLLGMQGQRPTASFVLVAAGAGCSVVVIPGCLMTTGAVL